MRSYEEVFAQLALHHRETVRHLESVRDLTYVLAKALGYTDGHAQAIAYAAQLHDIGKLFIPKVILDAARPLNEDEWLIVRAHPYTGAQIAQTMGCPPSVCDWISAHHERLDGSGYYGRTDIPREAMIIATTDTWDATGAIRPYRPGYTATSVRIDILKKSRELIGADIIDTFIALIGDKALANNGALLLPNHVA
jgi:putative nucleotidyltransferase with HDIG domain